MKQVILKSLIVTSLLITFSNATKIAIPLPANSLSIENSGTKQPIDAYQDGVGIFTQESLGSDNINNSEMNALVFKYGEAAKELNISIKEYVQENGNNKEKVEASTVGKFEPMVTQSVGIPANGTSCDDNNVLSFNDKYVNGSCIGIEAKTCLDYYNAGIVEDGIYEVANNAGTIFNVQCDMTNGGWTRLEFDTTKSIDTNNNPLYSNYIDTKTFTKTNFTIKKSNNRYGGGFGVPIDSKFLDMYANFTNIKLKALSGIISNFVCSTTNNQPIYVSNDTHAFNTSYNYVFGLGSMHNCNSVPAGYAGTVQGEIYVK